MAFTARKKYKAGEGYCYAITKNEKIALFDSFYAV